MTEQIEAGRAVRDKEMMQRLVAAQEDERRRIARDLHDELGQQLTALHTHKHARAKSVEVVVEKRDGLIALLIGDDGKGFNLKNKKNFVKGIGLTGMKERAALIGGTLEIESASRKGTTVFVRVPASSAKRRNSDAE